MSSSRRVLSTVAPSELSRPHLDFNSELLPVERALGILLDWETDQFMYRVELKQCFCNILLALATLKKGNVWFAC